MFPRIDLHTHSDCSDGLLSPVALVALAAQRQVELLALTDHDTVSGCAAASAACAATAVRFVAGVELSCQWREREIHIIGLRL
ncbi:MAG TPA: PHP domain-containing protein, partial [Steroidobacteraceae bacterium]